MNIHDYDAAESEGAYGMAGLDADTTAEPSWYDKYIAPVVSKAGDIATAAAQYKLAKQQAQTGVQPSVGVNVGVTPDVQKMLLWAGIAVAGFFVVSQLTKRGRR